LPEAYHIVVGLPHFCKDEAVFSADQMREYAKAAMRPLEHCQCPACRPTIHASCCAVHNMPAMPDGPCDCGALAASPAVQAVPQQPVATEWKMPQDQKLMQFINSTPLVMSLLYDINLLPEQIDNGRRWYYMVAVCEHMERALAALPASPAVPVQAAQAGWIPVSERMPPDDVPLLVYTPPLDGEEERIDFEWRDDGCWVEHNNCFDHYMAVTGGKGCLDDGTPCVGPAEGTPYTHWMLRPAAPSQPTEPGSQA
jgi:hypothetical protein